MAPSSSGDRDGTVTTLGRTAVLCRLILVTLLTGCATTGEVSVGPHGGEPWRALHLLGYHSDGDLAELGRELPALSALGVNVLILEVDYHFEFQSHPELRQGENPITQAGARRFARRCRKNGIRLIPQFQVLGHQSWAGETFPLLTEYPELDLTPGAFPGNEGIYCREWDPLNPRVDRIVFDLIDEILAAFKADALHVGMDEVFLLGSEHSPSTWGRDPAQLFAEVVNNYHRFLIEDRGVEMLMWGDRLIDGEVYDYGEWEASRNGTATAIDAIPKDVIVCDWHYERRADGYPSVPMFLEKGFRVLPTSWRDVEASAALIEFSGRQESPRMLGHLFTTWSRLDDLPGYPPMVQGLERLRRRSAGAGPR